MITDGKKWHYFAVKKLSAPLRGITSKHEGDFYCLNCSQFALTVALNYQNIKNNSERISKIRPFIDQYNWKEINFPSHKKYWKKFELNNK